MGYPMTWGRIVSRNGLVDGDYGKPPMLWALSLNRDPALLDSHMNTMRCSALENYERKASSLAGDLRRLESDARDEQAICKRIAERSGIQAEIVAAVLLEFFRT